ncbi:hypothetical protein ABL78_4626 [Leptomonas seymouri]|uniref:Uncharacterized protein n=1 Tax=Leptomonas seymouri TaxID=5684 RepID=A0A0N1I399_LEPSE|nr:hypothetical protein ABL78_4626 [Leptomonas seymouri]|eukprot:KPI86321.1 hypothetical protein ABL78_4626 [Leptomonas seymouri]
MVAEKTLEQNRRRTCCERHLRSTIATQPNLSANTAERSGPVHPRPHPQPLSTCGKNVACQAALLMDLQLRAGIAQRKGRRPGSRRLAHDCNRKRPLPYKVRRIAAVGQQIGKSFCPGHVSCDSFCDGHRGTPLGARFHKLLPSTHDKSDWGSFRRAPCVCRMQTQQSTTQRSSRSFHQLDDETFCCNVGEPLA